jgi:hypothetical protein
MALKASTRTLISSALVRDGCLVVLGGANIDHSRRQRQDRIGYPPLQVVCGCDTGEGDQSPDGEGRNHDFDESVFEARDIGHNSKMSDRGSSEPDVRCDRVGA